MAQTKEQRARLLRLLRSRKYRRTYFEGFYNTRLAAQIKLLREARGLNQQQLADKLDTQQSAVSKLENGGYGSWSVKTLRRVARALDVVLQVRFVSNGEALADIEEFSKAALLKPSFRDDPAFHFFAAAPVVTARAQAPASTAWANVYQGSIRLSETMHKLAGYESLIFISGGKTAQGEPVAQPAVVANDNLALAS